jgi:hypothetical protein
MEDLIAAVQGGKCLKIMHLDDADLPLLFRTSARERLAPRAAS